MEIVGLWHLAELDLNLDTTVDKLYIFKLSLSQPRFSAYKMRPQVKKKESTVLKKPSEKLGVICDCFLSFVSCFSFFYSIDAY